MGLGLDFDFDAVYDDVMDKLEEASSFANIGKFNFELQLQIKHEKGGAWIDATREEYAAQENAFLRRGTIVITVETTEFGSSKLYKTYLRFDDRPFKPEGYKGKAFKPNFQDKFVPSLKKTIGKNYTKPFAALSYLNGKYVEIRNVEANPTYRDHHLEVDGTYACEWGTPALFEVFADREAAHAKYMSFKGGESQAVTETSTPNSLSKDITDMILTLHNNGDDAETIASGLEISVDAVETVLGTL